MTTPAPETSPTLPRRRVPAALWVLLVLSLVLAAVLAGKALRQAPDPELERLAPEALESRLLQAESALTGLRRSQDVVNQRLTDAGARTSLLRDEVLGITQRSALIEDSVRELAGSHREGEMSLRVDEAELLLTLAQQRLQLAGDLPGAVRATELAASVLSQQRAPAVLNLRQALAQELDALRAAPPLPQAVAARGLDALEAALPALEALGPAAPRIRPVDDSGLQRFLSAFVQVRSSGEQDLLAPEDRATGNAALGLELALARTTLDHRDPAAFRACLARIDHWLVRLYAAGPRLAGQRARIAALAKLDLTATVATAGSTLEALHAWQRQRTDTP